MARKKKAVGYSHWSFLFNAVIEQNDLMELNLTGRAYTWSNDHMNPTFENWTGFWSLLNGRSNTLCL
jgi:hypothetical protein